MKIPFVILCNKWYIPKNFIGITIFPFIFLRNSYFKNKSSEYLEKTINHEKIHIKQQIELLIIPFYVLYLIEFFIKSFKYPGYGYRNLSFEREAYSNDKNKEYLKNRKFWSFIKYF